MRPNMKRLMRIFTAALLLTAVCASAVSSGAVEDRGTGETMNVAVIPARFSDMAFSQSDPQAWLDNLFNSYILDNYEGTGGVGSYMEDNLGDAFKFTFTVLDPVTLPEKASYYGGNSTGGDSHINELFLHACAAEVAAGVDFSQFDTGTDNTIDMVFVIFPGNNEAESDNPQDIWPMNDDLSRLKKYYSGKRLGRVACYSEFSGKDHSNTAGIGTICHELLHTIGLPDLYDVNGEAEGACNPLFGSISIMDKGNLNDNGRTPPYLGAIEREILGILYTEEVQTGHHYYLPSIEISGMALKVPTSNPGEYFLIEYRSGAKWDAHIGGSGLLVYHIDKSNNIAGSMTAAERWMVNAVNCCADHPCAELVNITHSEDVAAVFYPGSSGSTSLISNENDALWKWNGDGAGYGIKGLSTTFAGAAEFDVVPDIYWNLPQVLECNVFANQRDARIEWESDKKSGGATWLIRWGSARSIFMETAYPSSEEYTFENLAAGETYLCDIVATRDGIEGKRYHIEFTTIPDLTNYPLIAIPDNRLQVGDVLRLNIINITDEPKSQTWYYDGQVYEGQSITLNSRGKHQVKVRYTMDGTSWENLEKTIDVE